MDGLLHRLRPRGRFRWLHAAPGVACWLLLEGLLANGRAALVDNDSWMHAVRLVEIVRRGAWLGGITFRDGAPSGYALHWTLPFDLLVLAMAMPLAWLRGWEAAIFSVAPFAGPVTGILLILALCWAVAPAPSKALPIFAGLCAAAAPLLIAYGSVGICDHHLLIDAVMLAALGAAWRVARPGDHPRTGIVAGLAGALALWTALEAMPGAMAGAGFVVLCAILAPEHHRRSATAYAVALATATAVAFAVDHAPDWATSDRLGPLVVVQALLAAAVILLAVSRPVARRPRGQRVVVVGGAGLAAAVSWLALALLARRLSSGIADHEVERWFWSGISEFQSPKDAATFLLDLGASSLALAVAGYRLWRTRQPVWLVAGLLQLALLVAGALWMRMSLHASLCAAVILADALARLMERPMGPCGRLARTLVPAALICFPILGFGVLSRSHPDEPPEAKACEVDEAARLIDALPGAPVVLADVDVSPPLLYHSRNLRTVSGPYHVNAAGLVDIVRFGTAADDREARAIAARRQARFVLMCASDGMPPGEMRSRLLAGDPPPWLERVPLSDPASAGLRLYRVAPAAE